ncbi:MAG: PEGA domain-containing protein [bacterium]
MNRARRIDIRWNSPLIAALLIALTASIALPVHAAQNGNPTAAVISFKLSDEMEAGTGEALANIVRSEILQSGRLTLIDRDRTEAVLEEQGFMMAGGCYDVTCLVKMGKVLGAQRVITGSVNRLGRKYIVELRAANVGTGAIEALDTREFTGPVEELTETVRALSISLVNVLTRQKGVLRIRTDPPASTVIVDDVTIGFAPVELERPGGITYTVEARRNGYNTTDKRVLLPENDTLTVTLKLDPFSRSRRRYREPQTRLFVSGGFPLVQASSSFTTDVSWGTGESFGGSLQFGTGWRLGFGAYMWNGKIRGINESTWLDYGSSDAPRGEARVVYSDLILSLANTGFGPFGGVGLVAMDRSITTTLNSGESETYSTNYEIGWMATIGLEIPIHSIVTTQISLIFSKSLADDQSWWNPVDTTQNPEQFWVESFEQFSSFTAVHFSVGIRF